MWPVFCLKQRGELQNPPPDKISTSQCRTMLCGTRNGCASFLPSMHHVRFTPLNRELRESPDWLLVSDGLSVEILGKAGSFSVLWLDAAVSLTDQEIPEDTGGTGHQPIAAQDSPQNETYCRPARRSSWLSPPRLRRRHRPPAVEYCSPPASILLTKLKKQNECGMFHCLFWWCAATFSFLSLFKNLF